MGCPTEARSGTSRASRVEARRRHTLSQGCVSVFDFTFSQYALLFVESPLVFFVLTPILCIV